MRWFILLATLVSTSALAPSSRAAVDSVKAVAAAIAATMNERKK